MARRAGMSQPMRATRLDHIAKARYVRRDVGLTPNNNNWKTRSATPKAKP